jgi:hypothetical protein
VRRRLRAVIRSLIFIRDNVDDAADIAIERLMNLKSVEEVGKQLEAKRGQ